MTSNFSLFITNGPRAGSPWTPKTSLWTGFHLIHILNLPCALSKLPSPEGARLGHHLFLILSLLRFRCTVVFHFRLHYWRKSLEIKGFVDGVCTCSCYLIMSQVLRKKKSLWDQSWMKDLDFSWRGKREQKKKKSAWLKNSHKICKILKLKVLQCRGTSGWWEQAWLGPLGTVLGWGYRQSSYRRLEMWVEGTDPQNRDGFGQD